MTDTTSAYDSMLKVLDDYKKAVDATTILSITDPSGMIIYANQKFCEISGYSQEELIGRSHNIVRHPEMEPEVFADLWTTILKGEVWSGIVKNLSKEGETYVVEATIIPIVDNQGAVKEFVGIRHDITQQYLIAQDHEALIGRLSCYDSVTGLPNHESLVAALDAAHSTHTLIAMKIDNLIHIKDVLGFEFSDAYIIDLSTVVKHYFQGFDATATVYRKAFDEIAVVIRGKIPNLDKTVQDVAAMVNFFYTSCQGVSLTSPVTIAAYVGDHDLRKKISTMMVYAFENKRGEVLLGDDHSPCFVDELPTNIFWLGKYSDALEYEQVVPFYQPILNNHTKKIEKYECLARIMDNGEIISPAKFVDLATRAKQIPFLTKAVVRKAFEKFASYPQYEFSVNVSAMDLQDDFLLKQVKYWQEKCQVDPSRVVFEILESEDIYRYGILKRSMSILKEMGYKIAVDDFGTGYSNFISLFQYKVDFIKIDGSLIKGVAKDEGLAEMVDNLNNFIHMCGAQSVAEFISDEAIQKVVLDIGIDYSQGYYIGEPMREIIL